MPALLTRASMWPNRVEMVCLAAAMEVGSVTSSWIGVILVFVLAGAAERMVEVAASPLERDRVPIRTWQG